MNYQLRISWIMKSCKEVSFFTIGLWLSVENDTNEYSFHSLLWGQLTNEGKEHDVEAFVMCSTEQRKKRMCVLYELFTEFDWNATQRNICSLCFVVNDFDWHTTEKNMHFIIVEGVRSNTQRKKGWFYDCSMYWKLCLWSTQMTRASAP